MKKLQSTAIPIPIENIDTDQIIPARFLKATSREGFGDNLFRDWRYNKDNTPIESFVLNSDRYAGQILVAGKNFGCGSSREHAAWALADFGFKVVISSFFADIFKSNALNNNLLPIQIEEDLLQMILAGVHENPKMEIVVELEKQLLTINQLDIQVHFDINAYKKMCLMNNYDDIDYILSMKDDIERYEKEDAIVY